MSRGTGDFCRLRPEGLIAGLGFSREGGRQLPSPSGRVWGSAVSSPSEVRRETPTAERFSWIFRSSDSLFCYVITVKSPTDGRNGVTPTPREDQKLHEQSGYQQYHGRFNPLGPGSPRQLAHWEIDIYLPYCTFEDEDAVERKADTVSKVFDPPAECSLRQRAHCRLDDVASHVRQQLYVE